MFVFEEAYMDTVCVVYGAPYSYLLLKKKVRQMLIPYVVINVLQSPRKMCPTPSDASAIDNMYCVKGKPY